MSNSSWDRIVVFSPAKCSSKSTDFRVIAWLQATYQSQVVVLPQVDSGGRLDIAQLVTAQLLIEDRSVLSYWATLLSNATQKYTTASLHGEQRTEPAYIYISRPPLNDLNHAQGSSPLDLSHQQNGNSTVADMAIVKSSAAVLLKGSFDDSGDAAPLVVPAYDKSRLAQVLHDNGGPLCRDNVWLSLNSKCATPNVCGEYDLWFNDVYLGITPDVNSPIYRNSEYFKSPFTNSTNRKIVVSIGHNGLGNQFFQHYFAQRVAEQVHGQMYMKPMEGPALPPNTAHGAMWNHMVSDPTLVWDLLPADHPARTICLHSNITYARRPIDMRSQTSLEKSNFLAGLASFLDPKGSVRCLVTLGYFQDKGTCRHTAQRMWPILADRASFVFRPRIAFGSRDLVIHFRCAESHYGAQGTWRGYNPIPQ